MNGFQSDVTTVKGEIEEEDEEENVEDLVCKSNGFLPINLSNPKEDFFNTKGIGCGGDGRSIAVGLEEKLVEGFSNSITLGLFNSYNQARVLAHSFC